MKAYIICCIPAQIPDLGMKFPNLIPKIWAKMVMAK